MSVGEIPGKGCKLADSEGAEGLPGRTERGSWYVKLDALEG